jgi:hypothetical protein
MHRIVIFLASLLFLQFAMAEVPQQAQASHLVVPSPIVPQNYKYESVIIVTQCTQAVAVLFVDHDGAVFPQHFKDLSRKELMDKLLTQAPADHVLQVEVVCPNEKRA